MPDAKPAALPALLAMKCPNCRKGGMFTQKSLFPLKHMLDMPERCPVCGQKMELEIGFYYGTGYVSYGLTVGLLFIFAIIFALTYGFSYKDNSVFIFIGIAVGLLLLLQPWLMRISRVLYLWAFVKYGKGSTVSSQQ
jgi:uncharacterized protein (DUF983 family)